MVKLFTSPGMRIFGKKKLDSPFNVWWPFLERKKNMLFTSCIRRNNIHCMRIPDKIGMTDKQVDWQWMDFKKILFSTKSEISLYFNTNKAYNIVKITSLDRRRTVMGAKGSNSISGTYFRNILFNPYLPYPYPYLCFTIWNLAQE